MPENVVKPLRLGELLSFCRLMVENHGKKALNFNVWIGDDEEMNGIHRAYFVQKAEGDGLDVEELNEISSNWEGKVEPTDIIIS